MAGVVPPATGAPPRARGFSVQAIGEPQLILSCADDLRETRPRVGRRTGFPLNGEALNGGCEFPHRRVRTSEAAPGHHVDITSQKWQFLGRTTYLGRGWLPDAIGSRADLKCGMHGLDLVWLAGSCPCAKAGCMSIRPKKTASDLKLMIEERLRSGHPECERAEVIINPPAKNLPWSASLFGEGPTIDQDCRRRVEAIVAELRERFDLASS